VITVHVKEVAATVKDISVAKGKRMERAKNKPLDTTRMKEEGGLIWKQRETLKDT